MKTFITGVYGSGKTYLARKLAKEKKELFISFDDNFDYQNNEEQFDWLLSAVPENFIMDAVPLDKKFAWYKFLEYKIKHECRVICCYCPDQEIWIGRVNQKIQNEVVLHSFTQTPSDSLKNRIVRNLAPNRVFQTTTRVVWRLIKQVFGKMSALMKSIKNQAVIKNQTQSYIPDRLTNKHYSAYRKFLWEKFPLLKGMGNVQWYDSITNEYTSYEEAVKRIDPILFGLEERFYQKEYDVFYGDVELLNLIGYSVSISTWESLKDITSWKDKTVLDIGCFHGYFTFKIEREDAKKVIGLERSSEVLKTTQMICDLTGSNCEFQQWVGGDEFPECDTILFLNVLHHFGDLDFQKSALQKIPATTEVIFEINANQLEMIKSLFEIKKTWKSHRVNRSLLLTIRK
ncbi:MAG: DUF1698 domain-containing protein [Anaerolineaceae bacterium]|nr:DUF1698 domain-containing protein [Anaerolineaceae bacterium]